MGGFYCEAVTIKCLKTKNKEVHLLGLWETDSGCSITTAAWQVRCSSSVMVNKYAFQDFFSPANILPLYRRIMPSSHVCELDKKGVHFQSNTKWNKINISLCVKTCFTVLNALAIFIQPILFVTCQFRMNWKIDWTGNAAIPSLCSHTSPLQEQQQRHVLILKGFPQLSVLVRKSVYFKN